MQLVSEPKYERRSWSHDSRRWAYYRPREDDIVIATSAKCGTTWTQQIVSLLVFQSPEPRPIHQLSPWIDHRIRPIEDVIAGIEAQTHRRFIKSHLSFDAMPIYDHVRYIHTARDGRDAFMSWHNHSRNYSEMVLAAFDGAGMNDETIRAPLPRAPESPAEFFDTWLIEGPEADKRNDFSCNKYFELEKSYWRQRARENLLMVHYNDLKADLSGEMRRIAEFLNIGIREKIWPELVEAARFETMKKNGAEILPQAIIAWDKGYERFLFKGSNERWRGVLSEEQLARYDARVKAELDPALAAWLAKGRLAA
ncbi:MAG TPA: sulfotransferase domain-containing protein, partial [Rhizomicrobium sp.]|nr:sulfotransferase domain-containing protein [Rhizomicrobium sp.]